ncbi:MAG: 5-oxoprolinase subunit PxpA [Bdellovibrionales bacterium]|nr:5-oxoprolinase subunit PxpA [Bdellovibrionales bacterium]
MRDVIAMDLNADIGEGFDTRELLPWLSSVSIACGGHAGDDRSMHEAIQAALTHGLKLGAHPSYPDREGFGRQDLDLEESKLVELLQNQVSALDRIARAEGATLAHVKPHGALYNRSARDLALARVIARAIHEMNLGLKLVGLAGSKSAQAAQEMGIPFLNEAFADRRYEASGALVSRSHPQALITDPVEASRQAQEIALHGRVTALDGSALTLRAQTLCIHSDTPGAAQIAQAVATALRG